MLVRYNTESVSPSFEDSLARSGDLLNPSTDSSDDHHFMPALSTSIPLPRAKLASIQCHPTSTIFQTRHCLRPIPEYHDHPHQLLVEEYNEDVRYNTPLEERFHYKLTNAQEP